MFGQRRRGPDPGSDQKLSCFFCKKTQEDVRKLIAGPAVNICDECVQVCVEIIRDDAPTEPEQAEPVAATPRWSADIRCTLCRMPVILEETVAVESRGHLCRGCVGAVQAAVAQARVAAAPRTKG